MGKRGGKRTLTSDVMAHKRTRYINIIDERTNKYMRQAQEHKHREIEEKRMSRSVGEEQKWERGV